MTASITFQNMRATMIRRMAMRIQRTTGLASQSGSRCAALLLVRGGDAFERAPGRLTLRTVRRDVDDLLPRRRRRVQVLLAESHHDPLVEERLGMARIKLER